MNIREVLENELHLSGTLLEEVYEYIKENNHSILDAKDGMVVLNIPGVVSCGLSWEEGYFTILEFKKCLDQNSALFNCRLVKSVQMNEDYFKLRIYTEYNQEDKIRLTVSHGKSIPTMGICESKNKITSFDTNGIEYESLNAKMNYVESKMENFIKENIKNR